jgi:hypothetical protein
MNGEKRHLTATTGLLAALCIILFMAQNAWAGAENNNEYNLSNGVVFVRSDQISDIIVLQDTNAETHGTNTSQTIVLEIEDARTQESLDQFFTLILVILLLLVFTLLLVHILMHHTREDGETATTPAPSLLGEDPNPIEERQPREPICGEEPFSMPLALSVLEASVQDHGPGASTRVPSMGYPIGYAEDI